MHRHRLLAIALGFLGAMIIIRPGIAALNPVAILAIITALVWGSSTVLLKYMSRSETTSAMVIYLPLFLTPISLVPALFVWQWPSFGTLGARHPVRRRRHARALLPDPRHQHGGRHVGPALRLSAPALRRHHRGSSPMAKTADIWVWLGGGLIAAGALHNTRREAARAQQP